MYTALEYEKQREFLIAAQFTAQQAEAIMQHVEAQQVKAIGELATKRQLAEVELVLKRDIADVHAELKHDIADVRKDLNHRMTVGFIILFFMSMIGPNLPSIISWFRG